MTIKDVSNNKGPAVTAVESLESLVMSSVMLSVVSEGISLASDEEEVSSELIELLEFDSVLDDTSGVVICNNCIFYVQELHSKITLHSYTSGSRTLIVAV